MNMMPLRSALAAGALLLCAVLFAGADRPHPSFRLQYQPKRTASPVGRTLVAVSSSGKGRLYTLDNGNENDGEGYYYTEPVQLIELQGSPFSVGEAYGELLADQIVGTYAGFFAGHPKERGFIDTLDWLWNCSLKSQAPDEHVAEIEAMERGGMNKNISGVSTMVTRVLTGSNLPADAYNINILVEREIKRHGNGTSCRATGESLLPYWSKRINKDPPNRQPPGHCDFFAVWGSRTEDGRIISSRNLDIAPASGISRHKLIAVYHFSDGRIPYATVGFAGYVGALAGMSVGKLQRWSRSTDCWPCAYGSSWETRTIAWCHCTTTRPPSMECESVEDNPSIHTGGSQIERAAT